MTEHPQFALLHGCPPAREPPGRSQNAPIHGLHSLPSNDLRHRRTERRRHGRRLCQGESPELPHKGGSRSDRPFPSYLSEVVCHSAQRLAVSQVTFTGACISVGELKRLIAQKANFGEGAPCVPHVQPPCLPVVRCPLSCCAACSSSAGWALAAVGRMAYCGPFMLSLALPFRRGIRPTTPPTRVPAASPCPPNSYCLTIAASIVAPGAVISAACRLCHTQTRPGSCSCQTPRPAGI